MPRYAIADNLSGRVCGVTTAENPVAACQVFDRSHGAGGRVYEEHGPRSRSAHATPNAYAVYEAVTALHRLPEQRGIAAAQIPGMVKVAVVVVRTTPPR